MLRIINLETERAQLLTFVNETREASYYHTFNGMTG